MNSTLYETKRNYTGACLLRLLHKNLAVANITRPVHATHSMQRYCIAGFFRGVKFSRIDLVQIFEGKNFTNHSTGASVIIIIITRDITRVKS